MNRGAVVIGVEKTGGLPKLKAALDGAQKFYDWAKNDGVDERLLKLITDQSEPVTIDRIKKAIRELLEENLEQLLIYFGGHGVNLRFSEYWLLSGAPDDPDEAVNVATSEAFARRCGIPHVVLLSDSCRTAPEGIQAQSVDGGSIFPNRDPSGTEKSVDLFFATLLGSPSLEIKDKDQAVKRYSAVYTEELRDALDGKYREYLVDDLDGSKVLRPRRLKKLLEAKVPLRVAAMLANPADATQTPDARITSDDDAWLAKFEADGVLEAFGMDDEPLPPMEEPPPSLRTATGDALKTALASNAPAAIAQLSETGVAGAGEISSAVQREMVAFGPTHFETGCGFKVRGVPVRTAAGKGVQVLSPELVRVDTPQVAVNVLLEFADGRGVVLPAIRDFLATLSFENGELQNVSYEPSDQSPRWPDYMSQRDELAALRGLIASSAAVGGFRLDRDDAPTLTERIRYLKSIDPTMAIYAAYSYHNLGRRDLIRDMQQYLKGDIGITFFDVAMLAADRIPADPAVESIFPFVPMLAQGWSMIDAFNVQLPGRLGDLKRYVGNSLWTVFDPPGVQIVREALRG